MEREETDINARGSTSTFDLTVILRYTVRSDLRYAAQDRRRPACTPKSSRRLVYVFGLTSFLLVYVPTHVALRVYSPRSCTTDDSRSTFYDPRFTIHDLRFTIPFEYSASSYHFILQWTSSNPI